MVDVQLKIVFDIQIVLSYTCLMNQMIGASEYATKLGVSAERVRQLCKSGRISGARQFVIGSVSVWMIPRDATDPRGKNGRPRGIKNV
jgi:hypothetical protein